MSDAIGFLSLPVATPTIAHPLERTLAPGDPALVHIASFAATALQSDCGAAWSALSPGKPNIIGAIDGTRTGTSAARRCFYENPRLGYFDPADLPALFVYRGGETTQNKLTSDKDQNESTINIAWLPPRADEDTQRRERDTFHHAISTSLRLAFRNGRHPAWVIDVDLADADGLRTSFATSTSIASVTTFNGALAGQTMVAARPISITAAAAPGAYSTNPIAITGTLDNGATLTDYAVPTNANGGWTINSVFPFASPVSVVFPAQVSTAGAWTIGYLNSPDVQFGSLVQRVVSMTKLRPARSQYTQIVVRMNDGDQRLFNAYELALEVVENHDIDSTLHANVFSSAPGAVGIEASFFQGNYNTSLNPFNSFRL